MGGKSQGLSWPCSPSCTPPLPLLTHPNEVCTEPSAVYLQSSAQMPTFFSICIITLLEQRLIHVILMTRTLGRCWGHSSGSNKSSVCCPGVTSLKADLIIKYIDSPYCVPGTVIKNFSVLTH